MFYRRWSPRIDSDLDRNLIREREREREVNERERENIIFATCVWLSMTTFERSVRSLLPFDAAISYLLMQIESNRKYRKITHISCFDE